MIGRKGSLAALFLVAIRSQVFLTWAERICEDRNLVCVRVESGRMSGWTSEEKKHRKEEQQAERLAVTEGLLCLTHEKHTDKLWRPEGAASVTYPATLETVIIIPQLNYLSTFLLWGRMPWIIRRKVGIREAPDHCSSPSTSLNYTTARKQTQTHLHQQASWGHGCLCAPLVPVTPKKN